MNPLSPSRIPRICLAGLAALVLAAPAGARVLPIDEGDSIVAQNGGGAAATVATRQSNVAQYGWGAAATYAKQQTSGALTSRLRRALSTELFDGAVDVDLKG